MPSVRVTQFWKGLLALEILLDGVEQRLNASSPSRP
jgi:hypothetical protein